MYGLHSAAVGIQISWQGLQCSVEGKVEEKSQPKSVSSAHVLSATMGFPDKIALIGHNGWAAQRIVEALAKAPFHSPIRILAREGSDVSRLPERTEVSRYTWDDPAALRRAVEGVDILMQVTSSFLALRP